MDNVFDQMNRATRIRKEVAVKNAENNKILSRARMEENISKKARTIFIGDLNSFEKEFGGLWGHGKPLNELDSDELYFRRKWDKCRKEILDKGNNEMRSMKAEISEYTIERRVYHTRFPVLGGN